MRMDYTTQGWGGVGEGWLELRAISVNLPASGSRVPGGTERGALRLFQGLLERQKGKGSPAGFSPGSHEAPLGTQEPSRAPEPLPAGFLPGVSHRSLNSCMRPTWGAC